MKYLPLLFLLLLSCQASKSQTEMKIDRSASSIQDQGLGLSQLTPVLVGYIHDRDYCKKRRAEVESLPYFENFPIENIVSKCLDPDFFQLCLDKWNQPNSNRQASIDRVACHTIFNKVFDNKKCDRDFYRKKGIKEHLINNTFETCVSRYSGIFEECRSDIMVSLGAGKSVSSFVLEKSIKIQNCIDAFNHPELYAEYSFDAQQFVDTTRCFFNFTEKKATCTSPYSSSTFQKEQSPNAKVPYRVAFKAIDVNSNDMVDMTCDIVLLDGYGEIPAAELTYKHFDTVCSLDKYRRR